MFLIDKNYQRHFFKNIPGGSDKIGGSQRFWLGSEITQFDTVMVNTCHSKLVQPGKSVDQEEIVM